MLENVIGASIALGGLFVLLVITYYIYSYRLVSKRKEYLMKLHEELQVGKRVMFAGGIYGKILEINEDIIIVEVNNGASLEISRYSISEVVNTNI